MDDAIACTAREYKCMHWASGFVASLTVAKFAILYTQELSNSDEGDGGMQTAVKPCVLAYLYMLHAVCYRVLSFSPRATLSSTIMRSACRIMSRS